MSQNARWAYTAKATIWHVIDKDEYNKKVFSEPVVFDCDYILGGTSRRIGSLGLDFVIKDTFFTEYSAAKLGDFVALGEHDDLDPVAAMASEIRHIATHADGLDRGIDDYDIVTGV